MALYVTRPRRDEVRIGRGLPSAVVDLAWRACNHRQGTSLDIYWENYQLPFSMQRVDRFRGITRLFLQVNRYQQLGPKQSVTFATSATLIKQACSARLYSCSSLLQGKMSYGTVERGCPNSLEYRVFFSKFVLLYA